MPLGWVKLIRRDETILKRRLNEGDPGAVSFDHGSVFPAPSISVSREVGGESALAGASSKSVQLRHTK